MFTAERIDGSGSVTGYYFHHQDGDIDAHFIINSKGFDFEVRGDTVVQVEFLPRPMPKIYTPKVPSHDRRTHP